MLIAGEVTCPMCGTRTRCVSGWRMVRRVIARQLMAVLVCRPCADGQWDIQGVGDEAPGAGAPMIDITMGGAG